MKFLIPLFLIVGLYAGNTNKTSVYFEKNRIIEAKYDPFAPLTKSEFNTMNIEDKGKLYLVAIMNSSVFLNSHWYGLGDKINGYKIYEIKRDRVLAKKNRKVIEFNMRKREKIVKVGEK